jgi:hypothetical protein
VGLRSVVEPTFPTTFPFSSSSFHSLVIRDFSPDLTIRKFDRYRKSKQRATRMEALLRQSRSMCVSNSQPQILAVLCFLHFCLCPCCAFRKASLQPLNDQRWTHTDIGLQFSRFSRKPLLQHCARSPLRRRTMPLPGGAGCPTSKFWAAAARSWEKRSLFRAPVVEMQLSLELTVACEPTMAKSTAPTSTALRQRKLRPQMSLLCARKVGR